MKRNKQILLSALVIGSSLLFINAQNNKRKGFFDGLTFHKNSYYLIGWGCQKNSNAKQRINFFVTEGKQEHKFMTTFTGKPSSKKISQLCSNSSKNRFRIKVPEKIIEKYSNKMIVAKFQSGETLGKSKVIKFPNSMKYSFDCRVKNIMGCVYPQITKRNTIKIVHKSNPDVVTHNLKSGNVSLGISANGGGYINKFHIPGIGDIVGSKSSKFGRGVQVSIRDRLYASRYNPTMAGFHDNAGTVVRVAGSKNSTGQITLLPRRVASFNGDSHYDFNQSEKVVTDNYNNDHNNSDRDFLPEKLVAQDKEIESEFDSFGYYKNCKDNKIFFTPCFKIYYQFRFTRDGHFMDQYNNGGAMADGSPILKRDYLSKRINNDFIAEERDLSAFISRYTFRFDNNVWSPKYRFYMSKNGKLNPVSDRSTVKRTNLNMYKHLEHVIILSNTKDPNKGRSVALFRPRNSVNTKPIVTKTFDGRTLKREARSNKVQISDNPARLPNASMKDNMSLFGFFNDLTGMVNPTRLNPPNVLIENKKYEMFHQEYMIIVGTPNQIRNQIVRYYKNK